MKNKFLSLFLILGAIIVLGMLVEDFYGGLNISLGGIVALVQLVLTYFAIKNKG